MLAQRSILALLWIFWDDLTFSEPMPATRYQCAKPLSHLALNCILSMWICYLDNGIWWWTLHSHLQQTYILIIWMLPVLWSGLCLRAVAFSAHPFCLLRGWSSKHNNSKWRREDEVVWCFQLLDVSHLVKVSLLYRLHSHLASCDRSIHNLRWGSILVSICVLWEFEPLNKDHNPDLYFREPGNPLNYSVCICFCL